MQKKTRSGRDKVLKRLKEWEKAGVSGRDRAKGLGLSYGNFTAQQRANWTNDLRVSTLARMEACLGERLWPWT